MKTATRIFLAFLFNGLMLLGLATPLLGVTTDVYYNLTLVVLWFFTILGSILTGFVGMLFFAITGDEYSKIELETMVKTKNKLYMDVSNLRIWLSFFVLSLPVIVVLAMTGSIFTAVVYTLFTFLYRLFSVMVRDAIDERIN
jgi:hypothetical protein